jgi:TonB-linked SusC/RagA family outer membrane protein
MLFFAGAAYAQNIPVNGTISDVTGELIIGAAISEKGNERNGTITDLDGNFSLQTAPDAILVISYIGYARQEVPVGNGKNLAIVLQEDMQVLEEVVVVGYGTQKKASLTGSVTTLNVSDIREVPTGNLSNALAGRLAGVTVTSGGGGRPGNSSEIVIRSRGTWNSVSPLYVIDGVARDKQAFDMLSANDIENFSILKDAAAASVYGARASNGVVLVTTRKGKEGKPTISYSGSVGAGEFAYEPARETVAQRIRLANIGQLEYRNSLIGTAVDENGYHPAYTSIYTNGTDASAGYINTSGDGRVFSDEAYAYYMDPSHHYDRLKEVYRTPVTSNHSLNISGGSESTKYYVGANYYNETGIFRSTDYEKYSVRSNVDFKINRHLSASLSLNMDNSLDRRPTTTSNANDTDNRLANVFRFLQRSTPLAPGIVDGKYASDGLGGSSAGESYAAVANGDAGLDNTRFWNAEYTATIQWDLPWVKGLSAKALYNRYTRHKLRKVQATPYQTYLLVNDPAVTGDPQAMIYLPQVDETSVQTRGSNFLEQNNYMNGTYQLNGIISYSNTFGLLHEVGATLVYEQTEGYDEYSTSRREDFEIFSRPFLNFGSNDRDKWKADGGGSETGRISYVGRFTYAFAGKYLADFSFRQDLSSNFDPGHRRGFFPSGSLAWRLSEEDFLKERFEFLNNLKLRGSIGLTGNDNVVDVNGDSDPFQWFDRANINAGGFYYGGENATKGVQLSSIANPRITWEKSLNYNVGIDFRIFNMFTLDANYFYRKTYDIIGSQTANIPDTFGGVLSVSNYGKVNSFGCEVEVGFDKRLTPDLDVWAKGTFGWADNKLIEYAEPEGTKPWLSKLGKNWDRLTGPLTDGIVHQMFKIGEQNEKGEDLYRVVTSTGNTYIIPYNYYRNASDRYVNSGGSNSLRPGWIFYRDLRGQDADGNPTAPDGYAEDNSDFDRDWTVDHLYPPYNYSLLLGGKWKGLSLDVFLQGTAGNQKGAMVHNGAVTYWNGTTWGYWADDSYSVVDNPAGQYPMLVNGPGGGTGTNHFWVRDASFVRLKSMTLSYDLPKNILSKIGVEQTRIYVTGYNLALLWSNMKFHDPELGEGGFNKPGNTDDANDASSGVSTYPLMRTVTVGLNLSF